MHEGPKQAWLKALRSGEFEQGKRVLVAGGDGEPTRYCCLGVASVLAVNAGVDMRMEYNPVGEVLSDDEDELREYGLTWATNVAEFVYDHEATYTDGTKRPVTDRQAETLPKPVQEWLGLSGAYARNPEVEVILPGTSRKATLADLNDKGWTFAQIADVIERDL